MDILTTLSNIATILSLPISIAAIIWTANNSNILKKFNTSNRITINNPTGDINLVTNNTAE